MNSKTFLQRGHFRLSLRQVLVVFLKISLAAGLIYWLVEKDFFSLKDLRFILHPGYMFNLCLVMLVSLLLLSERWKVLLNSQSIYPSFWHILKFVMIGLFFNHVITGQVSVDLAKIYYANRGYPGKRLQVISSVVVDRVIGLYVMVGLAVMAVILDYPRIHSQRDLFIIAKIMVALFFVQSVFLYLVFSGKFKSIPMIQNLVERSPRVTALSQTLQLFFRLRRVFFKVIGLTVASQTTSIFFLAYVGSILGFSQVSLFAYFFVASVGFIISSLPIAPAGIGVGQAAFFMLFNIYLGQESKLGPIAVTSLQFVTFLFALVGGFFYITNNLAPSSENERIS